MQTHLCIGSVVLLCFAQICGQGAAHNFEQEIPGVRQPQHMRRVQSLSSSIYLSTLGSDTNDGTLSTAPLRSFGQACSTAAALSSAGAVHLHVTAGIFPQSVPLNLPSNITIVGGYANDFSSKFFGSRTVFSFESGSRLLCTAQQAVFIQDVDILASSSAAHTSAIAVYFKNCLEVTLAGVNITSSSGIDGRNGLSGTNGLNGGTFKTPAACKLLAIEMT